MLEGSIFVGPGSKYENRFEGIFEPDEALFRYKRELDEGLRNHEIDITPLKGKDLVCWCSPDSKFCHADYLLSKFEDEPEISEF